MEIRDAIARRYREIYIHSKLMIIDDCLFTLGSANLNLRSFAVDSEINVASDAEKLTTSLREQIWGNHTFQTFDGGTAMMNHAAMKQTFENWKTQSKENAINQKKGLSLSSFIVSFYDDSRSMIRFA